MRCPFSKSVIDTSILSHRFETPIVQRHIPGDGIWRWTIGVSKRWERIDVSITDFENGQRIAGLAVGPEGTLYALSMEAATSTCGGVIRSLNPPEPDATKIEFDLVNEALPATTAFNPTPIFPNNLPYLRLSGDAKHNELWTIDSATQIIYRF